MNTKLPTIIQGGMGAAVSDWRLAHAVSSTGQLGVVSGTALDAILARRLQLGDPGGHMRRALAAFPFPDVAQGILDRYFIGKLERRLGILGPRSRSAIAGELRHKTAVAHRNHAVGRRRGEVSRDRRPTRCRGPRRC